MITISQIEAVVGLGESETLEFKRSTAELRRVGETLCAFLNGNGGMVLIGVRPDGRVEGQEVADITLREVAAMLGRFEPTPWVQTEVVEIGPRRSVIVLRAPSAGESAPFVFDGKPYRRVGPTTSAMRQDEYVRLLLDRNHARIRWENRPALGIRIEDLDHDEVLRTRHAAIERRRLSPDTSLDVRDILGRLGLLVDGHPTQAAQMLYGTKFVPRYSQGLLKLGRFRGSKVTRDIVDNKQEHMHAFAMVREAVAWLDRTLPLSGRWRWGLPRCRSVPKSYLWWLPGTKLAPSWR